MTAHPQLRPLNLEPLTDRPLVSVLIANYNYARFLPDAIQSLRDQTYQHWEALVCDDGSTDESPAIIREMARGDQRIIPLYKQNGGQRSAWNAAYAQSRGQIICLLDSDDIFLPHKLEEVVRQFQEHPSCGFVLHPMIVTDNNHVAIQQIPFLSRFEEGWIANRLIARGGRSRDMPSSSLSFRREAADVVFPISEPEFRDAGDGYICTLLPLITEVSVIQTALTRYRVHGANVRGNLGVTVSTVQHDLDVTRQQVAAVNEKLASRVNDPQVLRLEQNLNFHQSSLLLNLLQGAPRRHLISQYRRWLAVLKSDDIYNRHHKVFGVVSLGIAIALPQRLRHSWISMFLGYNGAKNSAQQLLRRLRRSGSGRTRSRLGANGDDNHATRPEPRPTGSD